MFTRYNSCHRLAQEQGTRAIPADTHGNYHTKNIFWIFPHRCCPSGREKKTSSGTYKAGKSSSSSSMIQAPPYFACTQAAGVDSDWTTVSGVKKLGKVGGGYRRRRTSLHLVGRGDYAP